MSIEERCRLEREVRFYGDNGIVAREAKFRGKDGRARFVVEYLVGGSWTHNTAAVPVEVVATVKKYRDGRRHCCSPIEEAGKERG